MYRHVDILNKHGYRTFALHVQKGFRLKWFANDTEVICLEDFRRIYLPDRDIIVLPEDLGEGILNFPGKKVIFNQGVYLGFYCMGLTKVQAYPYLHPDVKGAIVVSDHNRKYLSFVYPDLKIYRVYNAIEPEKFRYRSVSDKKKLIACLPAKNLVDLSQVYHILRSRAHQGINQLKDYEWIFIENMSEQNVARAFGSSLIFIFLSTEEGVGRMPLEAMLSGSLVVAYNGGPLPEYLDDKNSFLSERGDVLGIVRDVEKIVQSFNEEKKLLEQVGKAAFETASRYSAKREKESVLKAWEEIQQKLQQGGE